MEPRNHDESSGRGETAAAGRAPGRGDRRREAGPSSVGTNDPATDPERSNGSPEDEHPDENTVIETTSVRQPGAASTFTPDAAAAGYSRPDHDHGSAGDREGGEGRARHDREEPGEHARKGGAHDEKRHGRDTGRNGSGARGHLARAPSLTRVLLYSGLVALVCGGGGWGYAVFFSPKPEGKESSDKHANSKESSGPSAQKSAGAGSGKGSGRVSESGEESPSPAWVGDVDGLRTKVEDLSKQFDSLIRN
jgi:hypothetical protein